LKKTKSASQSMMNGALVLTVSMVLVKVIGMLYKMPLANVYFMEGKGYFSDAYNLYSPIYAIAITGLPIAIARMVSERMVLKHYNDVRQIRKVASRIFLLVGTVGFAVLVLAAYPYAMRYGGGVNSLPAIFAIAPSLFFCCLMSIYRGYYEGLRNMYPTAISQVIEALCKLLLGLVLAMLVMNLGNAEFAASGTVFGRVMASEAEAADVLVSWSAAASILGITVGTLFGSIYLIARHMIKGDGITKANLLESPAAASNKELRKELIKIAIPIVLSSVVLNVTNLIDNANVKRLLKVMVAKFPDVIQSIYGTAFANGNIVSDARRANYIWGLYNTTLDFRTLIPTIVTALGVSALPAISAAWAKREKQDVQRIINTILRVSMMIALPAGFGMAVLSKEIMVLFYESSNAGMAEHASKILFLFGLFTWLMAVSAPIVSMLQGIGRADVPVKTLVIGTAAKLGVNYLLVSNPRVNVNGAAIGTVIFFFIVVAGNLYMLLHESKTKLKLTSVLWKPLFCSALCAATAWLFSSLTQRFAPRLLPSLFDGNERMLMLAAVGLAIAGAVLVYAVTMLLTRAVTADDLEFLPKGKKIGKMLAKHGLLG